MSETKPRAEQVRFISELTGEHVLDEYIESCERSGIPLYALIDKVFGSTGDINPDFLQFRIKEVTVGNFQFQYRSGSYVNPESGWIPVSADIFGAASTAAASAVASATTATTQAGIATTQAGIATTQAGIATTQAGIATGALATKQNADATLTALAGLATGADQIPYSTGTDTFAQTAFTPFARTILDNVNAAAVRTTIGLGDAAGYVSLNNTESVSGVKNFTSRPTLNSVALVDISAVQSLSNKALVGRTDGGSASAGNVGEVISSTVLSGAAVSLALSGTVYNITSILLSAGNWNITAGTGILTGASVITTALSSTNTTSGVMATPPNSGSYAQATGNGASGSNIYMSLGARQYNVSSPTTVYLIAQVAYSGAAPGGYGYIQAERRQS